ncbi:pyridoxamine 5'-phosphate oxidase family protein [Agaribacterium haliotis]|uniref:pyridoxamine 5'-phosphate oxidase family protein n=1 Tax=Agaribacterium haliotis TaxID=2013869 RepID=UPI000BB5905F|nr:pyridoxamine 5'-phosphate oxidase family protein [Agaribacterium haliotis]
MGQQFDQLQQQHIEFIGQQQMFFVATAASDGRVNMSPKGADSLRVIDANKIAWMNLTGSGNESAAHVLKQSRMTIMWCAFDGAPLILRSYGQAQVLHRADSLWPDYIKLFPASAGARQIFILDIDLVQASCGMSVPLYDYVEQRAALNNWAEKIGDEGIQRYWLKKNQRSLDGFDSEIKQRAAISYSE